MTVTDGEMVPGAATGTFSVTIELGETSLSANEVAVEAIRLIVIAQENEGVLRAYDDGFEQGRRSATGSDTQ